MRALAAVAMLLATTPLALADPGNPLAGKPLRYTIGSDVVPKGGDGVVAEVGYDAQRRPAKGPAIKYGNLFDEKNTGRLGPYLHTSDTAAEYHEGQIDPRGPGWVRNLEGQAKRAQAQGFSFIEWDNPDAYQVSAVLGAIEVANLYGLRVVAKNPHLMGGRGPYVKHALVAGIIVEYDKDDPPTPARLDAIRHDAGRPDLPVWFIAFGSGRRWAERIADDAQRRHMGVTYDEAASEYGGDVVDLATP